MPSKPPLREHYVVLEIATGKMVYPTDPTNGTGLSAAAQRFEPGTVAAWGFTHQDALAKARQERARHETPPQTKA